IGAFGNLAQDVRFSFHLQPSQVVLHDLSAFIPAFRSFKEKMQVEVQIAGTFNQLDCPLLSISAGNHFQLRGGISLQDLSDPENTYVFGNLSHLYADPEGIVFFVRNFSQNYNGVPPVLQHLGTVSFRGEVSGYFNDLVTYGLVHTDLGNIQTDLKLSSDKGKGHFAYSGAMKTENFELGKMLGNDKLGKVTFNLDVNGSHYENQYPTVTLKGLIASIDYSDYTYENITLDGEYKQGGFIGEIAVDDPNGAVAVIGSINTVSRIPTFNFLASIDKIRPHALHLAPNYEDTEMSVKIKANFTGGSIDEMNGEISIDSLQFTSPETQYSMNNLKITARKDENRKRLSIRSDFLQGYIEGDYSYR
ncbi:MAG: translocation/assembly module TamB, partial [Bacteroides sp.]|nr:translocation/assembly module TamB [Bacteroides sp.]